MATADVTQKSIGVEVAARLYPDDFGLANDQPLPEEYHLHIYVHRASKVPGGPPNKTVADLTIK